MHHWLQFEISGIVKIAQILNTIYCMKYYFKDTKCLALSTMYCHQKQARAIGFLHHRIQ